MELRNAEQIIEALRQRGPFRREWDGRLFRIWTGYNEYGWYASEAESTLKEALRGALNA